MSPAMEYCKRCGMNTTHNVNKQLGRVFYRCIKCGSRIGKIARNDNAKEDS